MNPRVSLPANISRNESFGRHLPAHSAGAALLVLPLQVDHLFNGSLLLLLALFEGGDVLIEPPEDVFAQSIHRRDCLLHLLPPLTFKALLSLS